MVKQITVTFPDKFVLLAVMMLRLRYNDRPRNGDGKLILYKYLSILVASSLK